MGVGENDGFNAARFDWERRPVLEAQRLEALKQAAVDEQPMVLLLHQIFRSGHRTGAAEKGEVETHAGDCPILAAA